MIKTSIKFFLSFLFLVSSLFAKDSVQLWKLEELDLNLFTLVDKNPSQKTYKNGKYLIKIWNPNIQHSENLMRAYYAGALEGIVPLKAFIFDKSYQCRGYVIKKCRPLTSDKSIAKHLIKAKNHPRAVDSIALKNLIERMREKTQTTKFAFGNISNDNIGILNSKCYLCDIDEIVELGMFKKVKANKKWKPFPSPYYTVQELEKLASKAQGIVEFWNLEELDPMQFSRVKETSSFASQTWHSKQVTSTYGNNYYVKIWRDNAVRSKNFVCAYRKGALDGVVPLKALIFDKNYKCRGYVTKKCRILDSSIGVHAQRAKENPKDRDSKAVMNLLKSLKQKTITTNFAYGDFHHSNLGMLNSKCYLIDLDGIVDFDLFKKLPQGTQGRFYSPNLYLSKDELQTLVKDYKGKDL